MNWLLKESLGMIGTRTVRTQSLIHDLQQMTTTLKFLQQQSFIMAKFTMSQCCGL